MGIMHNSQKKQCWEGAPMKRLLILGIFVLAAVGQDVEPAPTVAQCQADQRLWLSKLQESDSLRFPTFNVLPRWGFEMGDCEKVDPDNESKYYNIGAETHALQATRLLNFIDRHGLREKFLAEDAAGKR